MKGSTITFQIKSGWISESVSSLTHLQKKNTKSLAINFHHLVQKLTGRDFQHIQWFQQYFELCIYQFGLICWLMTYCVFYGFHSFLECETAHLNHFTFNTVHYWVNPFWGSNHILWNCAFMRNVFNLWNISVSMFHEYLVKMQVHKNKNAPSVRISLLAHCKCHQSS